MQLTRCVIVALLVAAWANTVRAQTDAEILIAKSDPRMQTQIKAAVNALLSRNLNEASTNWEAARELKKLKELTDEEEIIVEQLAIYATTDDGPEEHKDLQAIAVLNVLDIRPAVIIRVLAPYLSTDNEQLRDFAKIWFSSHDKADGDSPRSPPFQPVNYDDFKAFVSLKIGRDEEVPAGFIRYIYERSPGRALLVFASAAGSRDAADQLQAIRKILDARQQGKEPEPQPELSQRFKERRQARSTERREVRLAEHIVSNAIWLKENGFAERFQEALPEAKGELVKLSHKDWWARLYVAEIMRRYPELRQDDVLQYLRQDTDELVKNAANSIVK